MRTNFAGCEADSVGSLWICLAIHLTSSLPLAKHIGERAHLQGDFRIADERIEGEVRIEKSLN